MKSSNQLPTPLLDVSPEPQDCNPKYGLEKCLSSRPNWAPLRFKNGATTEPRNSSLARLSRIRASLHHTQHEIKCVALVTPLGSQPLLVIELYNRSTATISLWPYGWWWSIQCWVKDLRETLPRHTGGHAMPWLSSAKKQTYHQIKKQTYHQMKSRTLSL